MTTGFIGLFLFGSKVKDNVLENITNEGSTASVHIIMVLYCVLLICHIPYINFVGKEGILIMVDEFMTG